MLDILYSAVFVKNMKRLAKKYKSFLSDLAQFRKDLIENPSMGTDPNMIANNLEPFRLTHPGEVLKDELEYRGISQKQLAAEMGISYTLLNEVLNGKRQVNTELALLVEAALDIPAESLLQMQARYNMLTAKRNKSFMEKLQNVRKIVAAL